MEKKIENEMETGWNVGIQGAQVKLLCGETL